jgi:hypothetical protein
MASLIAIVSSVFPSPATIYVRLNCISECSFEIEDFDRGCSLKLTDGPIVFDISEYFEGGIPKGNGTPPFDGGDPISR